MHEFFYMDGKWMFIWSSYGITALAMILSVLVANWRKKKLVREIEESLKE